MIAMKNKTYFQSYMDEDGAEKTKESTISENYYIGPDQIKEFLDRGYEIYDDNYNKLDDPMQYAVDKNVKIIKIF